MFVCEFKLKICSQQHDIVLLHIWSVLQADLEDLDFIWIETEKEGEKVTKFVIIADPTSPHLKDGNQGILDVWVIAGVYTLNLDFVDDLFAESDKDQNKYVVVACIFGLFC